jgi:hypothetical protein
MKTICIAALFILLLWGMMSCKKDSNGSGSGIVGDWSIINDTSYLEGSPLLQGSATNYIGKPTDYFKFTSTGNLYISESGFDTATYMLVHVDSLLIDYSDVDGTYFPNGGHNNFVITTLTANNATLESSGITPEGAFYRQVNLKR